MKIILSILLLAGICEAQDIRIVTRTNQLVHVSWTTNDAGQVSRSVALVPQVVQLPAPLEVTMSDLEETLKRLQTNEQYYATSVLLVGGTNSPVRCRIQLQKK